MGANGSSVASEPDGPNSSLKLSDITESCIASVLFFLDPTEICKLARLNRSFWAASSADFIWDSKLPSNYVYILRKLFEEEPFNRLGKREIYALLSKPNSFDAGKKEVWIDKGTGGVCLLISWKSMAITGIDDRRYWNHIPTDESSAVGLFKGSFKMETGIDALEGLETDMVLNIFNCLDDPADLVRASIVSHYWRHFVIANGISRHLCIGMFPQLSNVAQITEPDCMKLNATDVGSSKSIEWEILEREHKVYASILQALRELISSPVDCILDAISASSTDNFPDESIVNTLEPRDRFQRRASYWSSKGKKDPSVPETIIYKLKADLCVVTEIDIQPFEAFFQPGNPIYSAKSVRFRMGHTRNPREIDVDLTCIPWQQPADDKFIWTYTSQEFPMTQENYLQPFKLPEPVLCIGGYLQIELSGRDQRQEMDGLFYICISHVKILGRPLSPAFDIEILDSSDNKFLLKYFPDSLLRTMQNSSNGKEPEAAQVHLLSSEEILSGRVGLLQYLVGGYQDDDDIDWEDDEMDQFIV